MVEKKDLDSKTYRMLLEFIKKEGTAPVIKFLADYEEVKRRSLVFDALCDGKHPTLSLVRRNKAVASLIRQLDTNYRFPAFLTDCNFLPFVEKITPDNISKQIEGAFCLEELEVDTIRIEPINSGVQSHSTCVMYDPSNQITGLCKFYSNGTITYGACKTKDYTKAFFDSYPTDIYFATDSGNFVLAVESLGSSGSINISLNDFGFDPKLLPSKDELSFYEPPKSLMDSKVYVKRMPIR